MFSYMMSKLRTTGPEEEGSNSSEEEEDTEDSDNNDLYYQAHQSPPAKGKEPIPPLANGFISKHFDSSTAEESAKESLAQDSTAREVVRSIGIITRLDESMPKGCIDRTYLFDISTFCVGNHKFAEMSKVEFEAFRSKSNPAWVVTSMKLHVSKKEIDLKETRRHKTIVVPVVRINNQNIEVRWDNNKTQLIPNIKELLPPYPLMIGDWLKVHLEQLYDEDDKQEPRDPNLNFDETYGKILSVEPNRQKTIVGKVTKKFGEFCIDDEIYYTQKVIKGGRQIPLNTPVRCVAVDSTQKVGQENEFSWRAVEVSLSNFMAYTADNHNRDEFGVFEEQKEVNLRYRDLYDDRFGIKIKPNYVNFQATKIDNSVTKTVTVINNSPRTFVLEKVTFYNDSSVCKFELDTPQREQDVIRTLGPDDSYSFQIFCTPLMMGRTKEMGVFDFGDFKIARDLIVTGLTNDEELLNKIKKPDEGYNRPNYQKFRGEQDVGRVMRDHGRTRIRGNQPVRAPFFLPKRIQRYAVPKEIWEAFKKQDEGMVRKAYPGAIAILDFENYMEKFHVSLWFEEVENDLRRRQYDLHNVRLKRGGELYNFTAPAIQDYQPPVLVGDPIDAFDPDDPNPVKYQGYIKKIIGQEVYADLSEAFNQAYRGIPLTVQFCLGRMTYKRQHHAVDAAVSNLGKQFLFPSNAIEMKDPRIPFVEDDDSSLIEEEEDEKVETNGDTTEKAETVVEIGLFRKPEIRSIGHHQKKKVEGDRTNKRAQSLRTPFVSDMPTSKFMKEVQLKWFNKKLNEEQKDAVRRILRGQARPLPYIIYGPPGTGKTVTVVEAIMQVNKLDPNSRVMVCAPTNHAADVIAEYLVNSKQYHPGEFVRFNGFMRQEQVMIEGIKEFCIDGEFLDSVARNRLVISTCTTAGQFFSLNLMPGHFTHVFIDEAGYCTEPEAMIAAVHLAIQRGGQLILAGDPNQLGPVLMSDVAQNMNLNLSLLERLMLGKTGVQNLYGRDPLRFPEVNCGYNPLVLTKLVKNYRAHPSLLKLPSKLFYNDDLISCASHDEAFALTQQPMIIEKVLKSQGVPIVFHGVQGTSVRERDSPSWCNAAEVMQVVDYVRKLKMCGLVNDDIGIITPYRKQAEKLRLAMQLGLLEDEIPKVGSIEEFQGGERKVVIISTVRSLYEDKIDSSLNKLGFIYNEKRFNVAITRAKSLMIIIGNPHVLWKDKRWNDLLRYCLELNAYRGCNLPLEFSSAANQLYQELKEKDTCVAPTVVPADIPTSSYNPDGIDDFDD